MMMTPLTCLVWQDKENNIDVFLLSTRAGGLGVNLTRADTVRLDGRTGTRPALTTRWPPF